MLHISLPTFYDDGRPATPEVLEVEPVHTNRYRLLHSPAFVDGVASGDVIELDPAQRSGFRVISRAQNLAVIVHLETDADKESAQARNLIQSIRDIGGVLDGGPQRMLVFSVPVSAGFQTVESLLDKFVQNVAGATWWYGNVYEAGDHSRPLNWWVST